MATPFIAQITMFAGNFAPRSYAFCQGQILSIAQNTALFSLVGTTYGGNGQTTFALPDLRGRVPVQQGQGPGLSSYSLGQQAGTENTTLLTQNLPAHVHPTTVTLRGSTAEANDTTPTNASLAAGNQYTTTAPNVSMAATAVQVTNGITGSNIPFSNLQPYLAINFIIALAGIFPSRN